MVKALVLFAVGAVAQDFDAYMNKFGKAYNGNDEYATRKAIYEKNMKWAESENAKGNSHTLGETPFTDLTHEEFKALNIRGFKSSQSQALPHLGMHEDTPVKDDATIDWTTKGAVTPVKDQGQCGSCWSFSTTGGLEGAWQLSSGNLVSMSEQQFVDCDSGSDGCNGGLMQQAFEWAESQAIATESSYPYTARDGTCKSSFTTAIPSGGVTGYKSVGASASSLKSAIQQAPISVAIEADQSVFQMYTGGVISSGCGSSLDHGVLAVGINSDGSIKVKNSWGSSWGANGFVNIDTSQCGITQQASYPVVDGSAPPAPTPGPTPPAPTPPAPSPTPSCTDTEDEYYCNYVVEQGWCDLIGSDCLQSCNCCDDPSACGAALEYRSKVLEALKPVQVTV